ncbi:MAG: response regulator [Spirochaetae bacterium HGW-Spirochaetae-7]|nr:MAG: response regulator [Spirochaetae bacterium HGW-Spirochaetae-7]
MIGELPVNTKKRILVVDDEQINLEFFEVMLSKLGFDVHLAENGQQALESVRRLHPDLVILDNIMPRLSGWEVTKILKSSPEYADFADTPIIMFSALDDVKDKVEGLELGADDYITKPFNFAEVLARIRAVLRSHELLGQLENREKRLHVGDATVAELSSALSKIHRALQAIEKAPDLGTARKHATEGTDILRELEPRVLALRNESDDLRKLASDVVRHASRKEPL